MSVIFSSNLTINTQAGDVANRPRILVDNVFQQGTVTASSEVGADNGWLENAVDGGTYDWWEWTTTPAWLEVTLPASAAVDMCAIALHTGLTFVYQYWDGAAWQDLHDAVTTTTTAVYAVIFSEVTASKFRIYISEAQDERILGVVMLGKSIQLPKTFHSGHAPITLNRTTQITRNRTEAGFDAGVYSLRTGAATSVEIDNIKPGWIRDNLESLNKDLEISPFIFAWRPSTYPNDVAYCWLNTPITASNNGTRDYMSLRFDIQAYIGGSLVVTPCRLEDNEIPLFAFDIPANTYSGLAVEKLGTETFAKLTIVATNEFNFDMRRTVYSKAGAVLNTLDFTLPKLNGADQVTFELFANSSSMSWQRINGVGTTGDISAFNKLAVSYSPVNPPVGNNTAEAYAANVNPSNGAYVVGNKIYAIGIEQEGDFRCWIAGWTIGTSNPFGYHVVKTGGSAQFPLTIDNAGNVWYFYNSQIIKLSSSLAVLATYDATGIPGEESSAGMIAYKDIVITRTRFGDQSQNTIFYVYRIVNGSLTLINEKTLTNEAGTIYYLGDGFFRYDEKVYTLECLTDSTAKADSSVEFVLKDALDQTVNAGATIIESGNYTVEITYGFVTGVAPIIVQVYINDVVVETFVDAQASYTFAIDTDNNGALSIKVELLDSENRTYQETKSYTVDIPVVAWTPANITTELWLDASDAATITESGGLVSAWNDKSGNARNFASNSDPQRPTLSGNNMVFSGAHALTSASTDFPAACTIVSVYRLTSTPSGGTGYSVYRLKPTSTTFAEFLPNALGGYQPYTMRYNHNSAGGGVGVNEALDTSQTVLYVYYDDVSNSSSASYSCDIDFVAKSVVASGAIGAVTSDKCSIGARSTSGNSLSFASNMELNEIVCINGSLDAATKQKLEGYLAHKWGLTGLLPGGHPYKSSPPVV